MKITIHHLEQLRSHRVLWLLEELEVPYQIKRYQREPTIMMKSRSCSRATGCTTPRDR